MVTIYRSYFVKDEECQNMNKTKNKREKENFSKLKNISTKEFLHRNFIAAFSDEIFNVFSVCLLALSVGFYYWFVSLNDDTRAALSKGAFWIALVSVEILLIYRFLRSAFSKIRAYCRCNKLPLTKEELAELEIKSFQEYANFIHKMATYHPLLGKEKVIELSLPCINEIIETSYALFPEETLLESYFHWIFLGKKYECYEWDAYIKWCERNDHDSYKKWLEREVQRKVQERMKN